jgi:Domain of unknown function (DUF4132)
LKTLDLRTLSDEELIKAHLQSAESDAAKNTLGSTEAGCVILEADADARVGIAAAGLRMWIRDEFRDAAKVTSILLRANKKDWTATRLAKVVEAAAKLARGSEHFMGFNWFPYKPLISAIEGAAELEGVPPDLRAALEKWKTALMPRALTPEEERELGEAGRITTMDVEEIEWSKMSQAFATCERLERIRVPLTEERKLIERLSTVLSVAQKPGRSGESPVVRIDSTDAVGGRVADDVAKGGRASGADWARLLQHARTLSSTKPSAKWLKEAAQFARAIDPESFFDCISDWLNEAGKAAPEKFVSHRGVLDATLFSACTVELLRGLAWIVTAAGRIDLAPAIGNLAEASYKKVPNIGPRNVKVGNAAVAALAALEKPEAVTQLSRLRLRVKHRSSRATIDKALATVSKKTGISPEDLAEMSVPNFDLDASGRRQFKLGKVSGELRVIDSHTAALRWQTSDGNESTSAPADVRKNHGPQLKAFRREAKDASIMLAAQSLGLERSYLNNRNWPFATWQERFLKHPLLGTLTRRLIWQFDDTSAVPHDGKLITATGHAVNPGKNANVSLWHPINSDTKRVVAWRNRLDEFEITQPFKQAHREIYVLTDAERRTSSYSNRFAAHILRQHQFAALCSQRGWDYHVQGDFDSYSTPTFRIPAHGLTAQFFVEAIRGDMTPRGIFLYLSSDQVRFGRDLKDVPPVVFSEVMRDVDLFVGVASVMNDPTWQDTGPQGYREYWNQWSFGELSENAKTRKQALERLLPRLAHSSQFHLIDRFLVVKGSLRTYKIHLGSSNILMEPNDQYLCIVPDPASTSKLPKNVFLPFEGDTTMSLILSKALLLANDSKIKDQTIIRQINS